MGARISPGFTIIETVLFLSVTGLLIMGVLVGTGNALNAQRYRDSIESFKDVLQTQYAELGSVKNSRANTWSCDALAIPTPGGSEIRGQSDCFMVGRYLRIEGDEVSIYQVLARQTGTNGGNDITRLDNNYVYNVDTTAVEESEIAWGNQIAWPRSGSGAQSPRVPRSLGILIIRSPDSGNIYTFSGDSVPDKAAINRTTFTDLIAAGAAIPGQGQRTICIISTDLNPSGDTAISLNEYAASASAIEVRTNSYLESIGSTTRC